MSQKNESMNRRRFLSTTGKVVAGAALSSCPYAAGVAAAVQTQHQEDIDRYDFILPRVQFAGQRFKGRGSGPDVWNVRPGGDANLLTEFSSVVRCKVKPVKGTNNWQPNYAEPGQLNAVVTLDKLKELTKYPFLFMTEENGFEFSQNQKHNLREYVLRGGFLLMDDCVVGSGGDFFYQSAYKLLEELFGRGAVRRIPLEHEVFHNVYDLGDTGLPSLQHRNPMNVRGLPYMHGQNHGARGVSVGDRLAVFLSSTDIHCGWCDSLGFEFGRENYEKAIQMGINIIMYALSH
ncbi:MAG: DUF4159 domain-containing protein [Phycisphaerales bacterium]|nr:MAG: DUF4159 domain-containing protein [Phycisphaerales bacterium]